MSIADPLGPNDCQGSYRSTADPKVALIDGVTFKNKRVLYSAIDFTAIVEGDIAIGRTTDQGDFISFRAISISGAQHRWPGGKIPFTIATDLPNPSRVQDAIDHWHAETGIRFVPRTNETDFVEFFNGNGCFSAVGRQGGKQQISLGPNCTVGNAIHEIGHTVGLWHEQSRDDRALHITLHMENCIAGFEHNFDQHITDGDDLGDYDYGSIMHYPETAFSKNGLPTIKPKVAGATIGERTGLSEKDIEGVKAMYPGLSHP